MSRREGGSRLTAVNLVRAVITVCLVIASKLAIYALLVSAFEISRNAIGFGS